MVAIYCHHSRKSAFGVGGLAGQEPCADSWRQLFLLLYGLSFFDRRCLRAKLYPVGHDVEVVLVVDQHAAFRPGRGGIW